MLFSIIKSYDFELYMLIRYFSLYINFQNSSECCCWLFLVLSPVSGIWNLRNSTKFIYPSPAFSILSSKRLSLELTLSNVVSPESYISILLASLISEFYYLTYYIEIAYILLFLAAGSSNIMSSSKKLFCFTFSLDGSLYLILWLGLLCSWASPF